MDRDSNNTMSDQNLVNLPIQSLQIQEYKFPYKYNAFTKILDYKKYQDSLDKKKLRKRDSIGSITKSLTVNLISIYTICNPECNYQAVNNPRRVLTKPSKPTHNDNHDNEDWDYILYVNDILGSQEGQQYQILDILGHGTFGQVVKCQNLKSKDIVAIKVIKNKPAYYNQSLVEVAILEMLNSKYDKDDKHRIVRMKDTFLFRNHLCIIFEMLSVNLYELIKQNQFRGLSTNLVRVFMSQILDALVILQRAKIIHCDLKPENILLRNLESPNIKIIDFGSACHENQTIYTYIQSRFYRSPEVLLGLPYTSSIDMWSVGCIAAELFLGLPLFPGSSQYNQVKRIVDMLGVPPAYMIEKGKHAHDYFDKSLGPDGKNIYSLKSMETYMKEQNCNENPPKKYFTGTSLKEIVESYPIMKKGLASKEVEREMYNRQAFLDFIQGLLNLNPFERWSPQQAIQHPFITGEKFVGPFTPTIKSRIPFALNPFESGYKNDRPVPVNVMQSSKRPRASTISSSKVQSVPPQLQRLIAMQQMHGHGKQQQPESVRSGELSMYAIQQESLPAPIQQQVVQQPSQPEDEGQQYPIGNSQERLAHHRMYDYSRRNSKPLINSPLGSKSAVYESSTDNPETYHQDVFTMDSSQQKYTTLSGTMTKSYSHNPIGSNSNNDLSQRQTQSQTRMGTSWTSHTSFDYIHPSDIQPRHGDTGERPSLPSRVPSTATNADWEMFDDLDAQGPYYNVSPSVSASSSRRNSMMDMQVDPVYSSSYDPSYYHHGSSFPNQFGRSPQIYQRGSQSSNLNVNASPISNAGIQHEVPPSSSTTADAFYQYARRRLSKGSAVSSDRSRSSQMDVSTFEEESRDSPNDMMPRRDSYKYSQGSIPIPVDHSSIGSISPRNSLNQKSSSRLGVQTEVADEEPYPQSPSDNNYVPFPSHNAKRHSMAAPVFNHPSQEHQTRGRRATHHDTRLHQNTSSTQDPAFLVSPMNNVLVGQVSSMPESVNSFNKKEIEDGKKSNSNPSDFLN